MAEVAKVLEAKVETFESIKGKTILEDSDLDLIAAQANKELAEEKKAKEPKKESEEEVVAPKKEETDEKSEEEKKAIAEKELKEATEKATKEVEEKKKEETRILEAKDEDLKPEEKTRKAELLVLKADAEKKAVDEDVKVIAKEYSITEDEARQSLEHTQKIREKYKDDPKGLAKANYFLQREFSRTSAELKNLKSAPPPLPELNIENVIKLVDKGQIKNKNGEPITREMVIEGYRKEYSEVTETVDDETVLKMAAKDYIKGYENQQKDFYIQLTAKAKEKRAEIKKSISEADKEYLPDIEPIIDNLPDRVILQEGFSLEDTIRWAKGKKFDTLKTDHEKQVKDAEERGYKRGKEEAKILGEKKTPDGSKPPAPKKTRTLSEAEKKRALDKYDGQAISDEEKYRLHAEELEEYEREHKKKKE